MSKLNGNVTITQVYDLVDKKIGEVNASVLRLETKFDILEQGRLSSLEKEFANMQGKMAVVAGVVSVVISIGFFVANKMFK